MWIESHQTLRQHPKTRKLAKQLGVSRVAAIGHLHCLWWWALDYAQDGDLSDLDAEVIAEAGDWTGEPEVFVDALVVAGFLDVAPRTIHDWPDFAGKLIERRRVNAERMRDARSANTPAPCNARATHVGDTCESSVGLPYLTVPNLTVPNQDSPAPTALARQPSRVVSINAGYSPEFNHFWSAYPLKIDKTAAWLQWQARIKDRTAPDDMLAAARNYAAHCERSGTEDKYIARGATFLGRQRKFETYIDGVPGEKRPPALPKALNDLMAAASRYEEGA